MRETNELSVSFLEMLNDTEHQEIPEDINEQISKVAAEDEPKSPKKQIILKQI